MPSALSRILHPRRTRQRDEFISGSSLGSSSDISNHLSEVLLGESAPLSMRFHDQWRHSDCPVEKWYQEQSKWSTKFTSIEHMRVLQPPFHHEYLLIHLSDGAICRLERMGAGARADAIRRNGCTAHDIIQRFSKGKYEEHQLSMVPSERVVLVQFSRVFDLLDVLEICYSLKQVKRSSVYTLQRYNCYFLCMTVLNVLVRCVAGWNGAIDNVSWSRTIESARKYLETMECDDAYSYLGLGICSLVDPDSSNPRKFILDSIGRELLENGLSSLNSAIDGMLWHKVLGYAAHTGLSANLENAANQALDDTSAGAIGMKQLLDGEVSEAIEASIPPNFRRTLAITHSSNMARSLRASAKLAAATYSMREAEDPSPLTHRLSCQFSAVNECIKIICGDADDSEFHEVLGKMSLL
ncbi:hypothetical protein B0J17DRAFT_147928 [Rhizoctonia solani]|nr:hypothetical protein B0J17DRAFT_147928 [Rhizoctonia solani]